LILRHAAKELHRNLDRVVPNRLHHFDEDSQWI
jgi:hypothetical protein